MQTVRVRITVREDLSQRVDDMAAMLGLPSAGPLYGMLVGLGETFLEAAMVNAREANILEAAVKVVNGTGDGGLAGGSP